VQLSSIFTCWIPFSDNLNVLIVVNSVLLSAGIPLYASPPLDQVIVLEAEQGIHDTFFYNLIYYRQVFAGAGLGFMISSLLASTGLMFVVNMAIRDVDFINLIQEIGWMETFCCLGPTVIGAVFLMAGVMATSCTYSDVGHWATVGCIALLMLFSSFYAPYKAYVAVWNGLQYPALHKSRGGWEDTRLETLAVLKDLQEVYGNEYASFRKEDESN
jgi:hypothetical protein